MACPKGDNVWGRCNWIGVMTLEVTSSRCFIYDGGVLRIRLRVEGESRLIAWVKCPQKVNANDNVAFAGYALAA